MSTIILAPPGFRDLVLCGSGATSRVYRAIEGASGSEVALKRLHRQLIRSAEALARLRRELEALSNLHHPSIARVRDVIRWQGQPTLVMDYVPGKDLKEHRLSAAESKLSFEEVERIGRALFDVLAATHGAGIVHRDIKPQNVRITPSGAVFLLDFGSARLDAASQLTATGTTVGTPEYMAPELFVGSVYDPRVDIYGVGATMFECLTGRPPYTADSLAELAFQRSTADTQPVQSLVPDAPAHLAQVIDRCLARAPEDRYATAALAIWALDHPEAERAFMTRRSMRPACLHCHVAIPPESTVCSECRSDHPFSYAPGAADVEIGSITSPKRFIEYVISKFPERSHPDHLIALAERCAALSYGKQRYASAISASEARHVADELREAGVRAEIKTPRTHRNGGRVAKGVLTILCLLMFSLALGSWLPLIPMFAGLFGLFGQLQNGVLASPWTSPSMLPSLRNSFALGAVATSVCLAISVAVGGGSFTGWMGLGFALAMLGLALSVTTARFRTPRLPKSLAPEPPLKDKLFARLRNTDDDASTAIVPQPARPLVMLGLTASLALAGTVQFMVLNRAYETMSATRATEMFAAAHSRAQVPADVRGEETTTPAAGGSATDDTRVPLKNVRSRPLANAHEGTAIVPGRVAIYAVSSLPTLLGLLGIFILFRRRAKIRSDAAQIFSELDLVELEARSKRTPPRSRRPERGRRQADPLVHAGARDAFTLSALRRASELIPLLPRESIERLSRAFEALTQGGPREISERSLLARCIQETDPEHRLRFELLALEGQLEAEAAEAWVGRMNDIGKRSAQRPAEAPADGFSPPRPGESELGGPGPASASGLRRHFQRPVGRRAEPALSPGQGPDPSGGTR